MSFDQWNNQADAVNLNQYLAQQTNKKKPNQTKGRGGTLTSLISELGGTGGALGGAAAGAALGSVVPVIGTGIGGLIGAGIGGFLGGTGGRIVENEVRDNRVGLGDALTEGAISGVAGAGPLKLLKAGKVLATAGKAAPTLEGAIVDATTKQAAGQPLKTSVSGKLTNLGNKVLGSQWGTLDKPTIRMTNPQETINTLANIGVIKPNDAERIGSGITGSNGLLNKAVVAAIGKSKRVPLNGIEDTAAQAIREQGLEGTDHANGVLSIVNGQLNKFKDQSDASPDEIMGVMKSIEKRVADLGGRGGNHRMATPERMDQAKALMTVHDDLQGRLFDTAGANQNVSGVLTPELANKLKALHPDNEAWAKHVDNTIMKSKTVGDLRGHQAPFVNALQMIDNGASNSFSVGGKIGNNIDSGGSLSGMAAKIAANVVKDPAARIAGTSLRSLGGNTESALGVPTAKGIIARQTAGNVVKTALTPVPVSATGMETGAQTQGDLSGQQDMGMQPPGEQSPYSRQNLLADIQRDPKNAQKYVDYYTQLDGIFNPAPTVTPGYNKPTVQQYSQGMTGMQSVGSLEGMINQSPDIVNRAATPGQNIPVIGGLVSGAVGSSTYRSTSNNILNSIARINTGANMPPSEEAFYARTYLPQPGDPPQTVQAKLQQLRQFFSPIVNYQSGSGNSLSDAIMSAQQVQGAYQ